MIPVYEQKKSQSIGYNINEFVNHFVAICNEHKQQNRAKKYAFIFCDYYDSEIDKVLKDKNTFIQLDRLVGNHLSVFYFWGRDKVRNDFNEIFLHAFKIKKDEVQYPFVLTFSINGNRAKNPMIFRLHDLNPKSAFHELFTVLQKVVEEIELNRPEPDFSYYKFLVSSLKVDKLKEIGLKALIEVLLAKGLEKMIS